MNRHIKLSLLLSTIVGPLFFPKDSFSRLFERFKGNVTIALDIFIIFAIRIPFRYILLMGNQCAKCKHYRIKMKD